MPVQSIRQQPSEFQFFTRAGEKQIRSLETLLNRALSWDSSRLKSYERDVKKLYTAAKSCVAKFLIRDPNAAALALEVHHTAEAMLNSVVAQVRSAGKKVKPRQMKSPTRKQPKRTATQKAAVAQKEVHHVPAGFSKYNPGAHGGSHCGPAALAVAVAQNDGMTNRNQLKQAEKQYDMFRTRVASYLESIGEFNEARRYQKGPVDQGFFSRMAELDNVPTLVRAKGNRGEGVFYEYSGPRVINRADLSKMRFFINTGGHWEVLHSSDIDAKIALIRNTEMISKPVINSR